MTTSSRLYIRDARTKRVHEVMRSGVSDVRTFCGKEYRERSEGSGTKVYDLRTTWPNPALKRCSPCAKKALRSRR